MKRLLLFAMAIIFAMQLSAQTNNVVVGDSTSSTTSYYLPSYMNYCNSFSESLYPASSLSPGLIMSMSYYVSSGSYNEGTLKIYMKEVDNTSINSFQVGTDFTEVYSGPCTWTSGRNTFELTTPFVYTGAGNLLVAVIRDGNTWGNYPYFRQASSIGTSVYDYDDSEEYFITTNPSYTYTSSNIPVTMFEMAPLEGFCYPPTSIVASDITTDGVLISWEAMDESSTTFGLAYKTLEEEEWNVASENITDLSYELTGLDSYTRYQIKLWTICDESNSPERMINILTLPTEDNYLEIPYEQNFDDLEDLSSLELWTVNNNGSNHWYLGPIGARANAEDGEGEVSGNGLYISNDQGASNSYSHAAQSSHLSALINVEEGSYYGIEFDYRAVGELSYDDVRVSLYPLGAALPTSNSISNVIGGTNSNTNEWTRVAIPFPNDLEPTVYQLVISWRNDGSGGSDPAASIDNLYIFSTPCARVNQFEVSHEDAGGSATMTVNVVDELNEGAEYLVEYRYAGDTTWYSVQSESPVVITDLPYSSRVDYRVTADCSGDLAVMSNTFTAWSYCYPVSEFPYLEDFETVSFVAIQDSARANRTAPHCWYNINGGYSSYYWSSISSGNGLPIVTDSTTTNSKALYFYGTTSTTAYDFSEWMISPIFELTGNERVNFQYKISSNTNSPVIDVYAMNVSETDYSAMADTTNFTLLTTINTQGTITGEYNMAEVFLNEFEGYTRIALAVRQQSSTFYIDDFRISEIPACPDVYGLSVVPGDQVVYVSYDNGNITEDGVTISYAEISEGDEFDPESGTTASISYEDPLPYAIEGFTAGSTYAFAAQQACGGEWSEVVIVTIPIAYPTPVHMDFDTPETTPVLEFSSNSTNVWHIGTAVNNTFDEAGNPTENGGALYISTDNGATAGYAINTSTEAFATMLVSLAPAAETVVSFDWKAYGESCCDYLQVYMVPFGMPVNTAYLVTGNLNYVSSWQSERIVLPPSYVGIYQLVFKWRTDSSVGTQPGPQVDNIHITQTNCSTLAVDWVASPSEDEEGNMTISVNLTDEVNEGATYEVSCQSTSGTTVVDNLSLDDFPVVITDGILHQTSYTVTVSLLCDGEEEATVVGTQTLTTPCQALQLPWNEDFTTSPYTTTCWERYQGLLPASGIAHTADLTPSTSTYCWYWTSLTTGTYTSYMLRSRIYGSTSSGYQYWSITPVIDLGDDETPKQIAFDLALRNGNSNSAPQTGGTDDKIIVFVSLDNGATWDISNALVFADGDDDTEHNMSDLTQNMQRYAFKLVDENDEPITGQVRFAFYSESTVSNATNYACVDNITVEDWSECPAPYNVLAPAVDVMSTTATVTFQTWGPATAWEYVIVEGSSEEADLDGGSPISLATTDPIELTELAPGTTYTVGVRSLCDENSPWTTVTFTTLAEPEAVPYETGFDDEDNWFFSKGSTSPNAWTIGEETGNDAPAVYISNDGTTYAATQSSTSTISHIWKDFDFGETELTYELVFDWKVTGRQEGTSVYGGIGAYVKDIAPLPSSGTLSSAVGVVAGSDQWQTQRIYLGNVVGQKRVIFSAIGYTTEGELVTPAAIDNVSIVVSLCDKVQGVTVSNHATTTLDVAWTATSADSYIVTYYPVGVEDAEAQTVTVTDANVTLTDLIPATEYIITVTGVCGSNEAVASNEVSAYTTQVPATIPYLCDFEDTDTELNAGWLIRNGNITNKWYIGTPTGGSSNVLFVSQDGTSTNYNITSSSVVIAEKLFQLGATDSIRISFDVQVGGEGTSYPYDYLKVFWLPAGTVFLPGTSTTYGSSSYNDGVIMSNFSDPTYKIINFVTTQTNMSVTIPNNQNETRKLVFVWKNDGSSGTPPGAIIDNVMIEPVGEEASCIRPVASSVTATGVGQNSATISWTDNDENHSAWNVYYKAAGEEEWSVESASETTFELTDLSAGTTYSVYVTTDCGDEESLPTNTITFTTVCGTIDAFPYVQGFEGSVDCWTVEALVAGSTPWSIESEFYTIYDEIGAAEGSYFAYHTYDEGESSRLITPAFDLTSLTNPYARFYYALGEDGLAEDLIIKYRTSATGAWTTLRTITTPVDQWVLDSVALPNPSDFYQLAFESVGVYGYGVGLDAFTVYNAEGEPGGDPDPEPCDAPTALTVSNITQTTADVTWTGTATTYEFRLNAGTPETLTTTSKSLTGLTANTTYTVEVRAVCEDQTSDWVSANFTTPMEEGSEVIAPVVTTLAATAIDHQSATLNGTITAGNEAITAQGFKYKVSSASTWTTVSATGTTIASVVNNLTEQTTYIFKAFATTASGTVEGAEMTFTTTTAPIVAPVVTTLAATAIDHQSATLNGTITAGSETITAQGFKYKVSSASTWTTVSATGTTLLATINNLTAQTAYTFKAFATTASGTVEGAEMTFTTTAEPIVAPTVTTLAASAVDHQSAILNGTIAAGSETITAQGFKYKAQSAADWTTVSATGSTISAAVNNLTAQTAYVFKAFATTASGTVEGNEMTFTTASIPVVAGQVTTTPATEVGNTSATLNGALVSAGNSENFTVGFALATTADFTLEDANVQNITATVNGNTFSQAVNNLVEGQTYFFRAYITNEAGTTYGAVETFTLSGLADAVANTLQVSLYPNPTQDVANLRINGLNQDAKIVISDLQGRILSQDQINAGTNRYTINVSDMASGVYYIRIVTDNVVSTQKLIVE